MAKFYTKTEVHPNFSELQILAMHLAKTCDYTRKMVPIPRRASSFIVCMYVNRKEEEVGETEQQQTYQFT